MVGLAAIAFALLVPVAIFIRAARVPRYETRPDPQQFPGTSGGQDVEHLVEELLGRMSLTEKLNQLSGDLPLARFGLRYANLSCQPTSVSSSSQQLGLRPS